MAKKNKHKTRPNNVNPVEIFKNLKTEFPNMTRDELVRETSRVARIERNKHTS